jgi:hypothetical protein
MKTTLLAIAAMTGIVGIAPSLFAQDDPKPVVIGDFDNSGSVTAGYRLTSVAGYQPMFQQLFDMNSGFRVMDFSLFGRARDGTTPFADSYSLVVSGLGGDPFTTAQLTVKKKNLYDLRVDFRQSHYYFNENDAAVLPNGLDGLTSNHNWATVRKMGSINLLVHATNNLRFSFEYYRNTQDGVMDTTQTFDFFGSPSSFGNFARANPYYLIAPVSDASNRVTGGVDYTLKSWSLHYKIGMQSFQESINGGNASTGERSINVDDPITANELLTTGTWTDYRRLTTPVSELSWNGKLLPRFRTHGSYLAYRYSGPTALDMSAAGDARGATGTATTPYVLSESSQGSVTEMNQVAEEGFSYELNDWLTADATYKYSRSTLDANANFFSVFNGTPDSGITTDTWATGTHLFDYDMIFTPVSSLTAHIGVTYLKSDIEFFDEGVSDPLQSKRMKSVWPTLSLYYAPSKKFSIRADVDEINNGTPYTRLSPHTDVGSRFVARYHPFDKVWLDNTTTIRDSKQLDASFESTVRTNATTATWDFSDRLSGFGGFSYDSFFASGTVDFLRGPAPLTNLTLLDQTVDRVWQGGLRAVPVRRLTFEFSGNYVRVTGLGQVQGEAPLYGPMKFPYAAGSLSYDVPQVGKLIVQLQRAYYSEQIVPGNNFSSNILLIAWKRSF